MNANDIFETIIYILSFFGAGAIALVVACITDDIKQKFRKWRLNECKIKCLCHHQFEERMELPHHDYTEYVLVCRKCKKRKVVSIWKDETQEGGENYE